MSRARRGPRVGVISLGCSKNLVDTEVMLGHLDGAGCSFVSDPADAEVLVVNTCGFIEQAREESIRTILEAARHKEGGTLRRLVVAGCLVQRSGDELRASLPEVDAFVGLDALGAVVEAATGRAAASRPAGPLLTIEQPAPATYLYDHRTPRKLSTSPWTAFVKIAEGCDHTCAFCAIPSFRGLFRSRRLDSVVAEVERMARSGVREVNLVAQDSSHYGRDLGMTDGLAQLLEQLDAVADLRWIRVHYLYPHSVSARLVDAMARLPRVVPYVDVPLQHAHPATLARMRRGGSPDAHLQLLERFRRSIPGVTLRTTLLVGFPGETDEEFAALLAFVRAARFDHLGVFTYSHETGTPAFGLADDVPAEVKQARYDAVMEAQREIVEQRLRERIGDTVEVLLEGAHADTDHLLVGRTAGQAPDVDGQVLLNDGLEWAEGGGIRMALLDRDARGSRAAVRPGDFLRVEITDTAGYDLVGRVVGLPEGAPLLCG